MSLNKRMNSISKNHIQDKFKSLNSGIEYIVNAFYHLDKIAINNIKGLFNKEELIFLLCSFKEHKFNNFNPEIDMNPTVIRIMIDKKYDNDNEMNKTCNINFEKFEKTIIAIPEIYFFFMICFIRSYWEKYYDEIDIENYIKPLL